MSLMVGDKVSALLVSRFNIATPGTGPDQIPVYRGLIISLSVDLVSLGDLVAANNHIDIGPVAT